MRTAIPFFDSMKIRDKIFAGYIAVVLLAIGLVIVTWTATNRQMEVLDDVAEETVPQLLALESLRSNGQQLIDAINTYAFSQTVNRLRVYALPSDTSKELADMTRAQSAFALALERFGSTSYDDDPGSVQLERSITNAAKDMLRHPERIQKVANGNHSIDYLLSARTRFENTATAFKGLIDRSVEWERRELIDDQADSENIANETLIVAAAATAVVVLISLIGGFIVSNRIACPILRLRDSAGRMGHGDFSAVERSAMSDEVGQLVNAFHDMARELQRDSTARKASEEVARLAEARLTDAIESFSDGFILWGADERLLACNGKYKEYFARAADLMVPGRTFEEIVRAATARGLYPDAAADPEAWIAERLRRHREASSSFELKLDDGRWLRVSDQHTKEGGIVGIRTDITERRKAEVELREANEMLKATMEKLGRQEKLATLGQVAGTVSHELRNPLGAIRNSMAVIRQLTTGKALGVERSIDRIDRSIERCNGIITDLLEFTRMRELNRESVPIDKWLVEVLDEHSFPAGIVVERRLSSACDVALDGNRFRQVMVNLLDNAAQAMTDAAWTPADKLERKIMVSTEAAGPHVRLCVADTGPGISPETLSKIFEPLFTTKNFGVGLGLPTVRQIVEQHGGTIDVESAVDGGTDFTIWLPRYFAATQVSADSKKVKRHESSSHHDRR